MSWLRNPSLPFARLSRSLDPRHDYEPQACYSSFCKHWQQAYDVIQKSQPSHLHDDVLSVVNHLEQLTTLLVLEAKAREISQVSNTVSCLEHLLSENLLDKLYEWGICTGKYENAVRLEELKLFGSLVSHYGCHVIAAEPFIRPLLKLLSGFRNELTPLDVESQLVKVLNQLCVVLMQNMTFLDLFFLTTHTQNGSQAEFIILRLLLPAVHRDGNIGSTARDALLLCAKMSQKCKQLADCTLRSNTSVVLATGLSGLYSLLPRTLSEKMYRLTPDDFNQVHKLTLFIDSLEFCNAVAEVAHPTIKKQLLDLLYQGFLVPVMGPALLQAGASDQATAMCYLELVLRCVTERGLLRAVLHFLFVYEYDSVTVVSVLVERIRGNTQLSLVSLALIETLIDLNCEDVMIELVYKYLLPGRHLTAAHRHKITNPDFYREAATSFLSLSPKCCSWPMENTKKWVDDLALSGRRILEYQKVDDRNSNGVNGDIAMSNLVQEVRFNYGNPNETLYGNYHAYLNDARFELVFRTVACSHWSSKYDAVQSKPETNNNREKEIADTNIITREQDSLVSICTSGYDTLKTSVTSEKEPQSLTSLINENLMEDCKNGIHSGHESLVSVEDHSDDSDSRYKGDSYDSDGFAEDLFVINLSKPTTKQYDGEMPLKSWKASAESIIGPLLSGLLKKAALLLESDVTVNCRVTSVLSKLTALPTPLLTSLLLCQGFALPPNVPSLFQILSKLKDEVDELTHDIDNSGELVDKARVFLIQRELTAVRTRNMAAEDSHTQPSQQLQSPRSASDLKRTENKRRSLSASFTNMFSRRLSSSSIQQAATSPTVYHASPQKRPTFTQEDYWNQSITLRSVLNAVILDEWLKELAALSEEHALRLSSQNYEDDTFIRTVAL